MKVLIFCWNIYPENTGGAGKSIYYTALGLSKIPEISAVHVLTSTKGVTRVEKNKKMKIERYNDLNINFRTGENPFRFEDIKLKLRHLKIYKKWEDKIKDKCMQFNPDIIHCNDPFVLQLVRRALRDVNIPIIVSVRGYWPSSTTGTMTNKQGRIINRWGVQDTLNSHGFRAPYEYYKFYKNRQNLKKVTGIHFISEYIKNKTEEHIFFDSINRVIMNPRQFFHKKVSDKKRNTNEIAYVGELTNKKGLHKLLDALGILVDEGKDYKLVVAGKGPSESNFKKIVKEKGLEKHVTFLGWVDNPDEIYKSAVITVVPSLWPDPLPGVAFEPMGYGSIPIVSEYGGMPETVPLKDLIVNVENPKKLAEVIKLIMENQKKQKEIRNQFEPWLKRFDMETVAKQFLSLYEEVIKKNKKKLGEI